MLKVYITRLDRFQISLYGGGGVDWVLLKKEVLKKYIKEKTQIFVLQKSVFSRQ